ncbi:hypothetical protein RRX38_22210 [Pseudomonas sp. DTU_2021_1001937_2_SI_NGA_ILE_001]|uniref:hypothetical protein n=1 Tax=Pseudomonas sp. DTU_2021_1001937_2_SI_NGA_ILE_001 TaxID=3077589 RepID=UPI0025E7EA2C|nr:hypothetical protein [Pseudomonas sp. DTU_2021_1001937_2_SI_NGA_ILE_001]WNW13759.1 hypothetical protein RRX38_22210 [Pseudomonas sp. DTU_2021_1001937_2_SI_NGA_ILE_001]
MKLDKKQAIDRRNQQLGGTALTADNSHFAILDRKRNIWWFDLPVSQLKSTEWLNLLLYTAEPEQLQHLKVPTNFLRAHISEMEVRNAGKRKASISLELSADRDSLLQDLRPKGSQLGFAVFLQA